MVVIIGKLVEEGARLQDEGGQNDAGQVHARPQLLQDDPHQALVLIGHRFCLRAFARLKRRGRGKTLHLADASFGCSIIIISTFIKYISRQLTAYKI